MTTLVLPPGNAYSHQSLSYRLGVKRMLDIAIALLTLCVLAPLFLIIAFVVALDGGPVFFGHPRIGRYGQPFQCLKFRTMFVGAEGCLKEYLTHHPVAAREWEQNQKLAFDPRITAIGRSLRCLSLDELPQLINVLRGEMSLVGPRPVTLSELRNRYQTYASGYLSLRPGLTGLWQVSGRNRLSYDDRIILDMRYTETQSLWGDLCIMGKTVTVVLRGDGK
jgi:exopolysaccharide production protein ExoY